MGNVKYICHLNVNFNQNIKIVEEFYSEVEDFVLNR